MGSQGLISPYFLLVFFICVCGDSEVPIDTSVIDCNWGTHLQFGPVDEGYTGVVEVVTGIPPGTGVKLVDYDHPAHLEYLELSFTLGDTNATVHTKKPLDADAPIIDGDFLYYSIMCDDEKKSNNSRMLEVNNLNDHRPIFEQKLYSTTVSEEEPVGIEVLRVRAVDADSIPEDNTVTYSVEPASDDFTFIEGAFRLKKRLNYNVVQKYDFTVTARDNGGLNDTTTVVIHVQELDNLYPYFNHSLYQAFIPENQVGSFRVIEPEEIKAQDGDTGINVALTYNISAVSPDKYQSYFNINSSSGVVTVVTAFDREEMSSSVISVSIKATQTDDSLKTADAVVSVTIEDENDNPPKFNQSDYSVSLLENSPVNSVVFKAVVTDLDQGGFMGSLQILPESVPFSISPDGTVRVENSTALDRETTESFSFQVVAVDQVTDGLTATAQVNIILMDDNDNAPQFPPIPDPLLIPEGNYSEESPGEVFTIVPTDPDLDSNGEVTLSLFPPHPLFRFREDGTLLAVGRLDRESRETYELVVKASDRGSPSRMNITSITVSLTDVNDNRPEFSSSSYVSSILLKDAEKGKLLLNLTATDRDAGDNSLISYSFSAGNSPYLALDSQTGAVTLTSNLADVKEDTTLVLTAKAEDHGEPPLSSTAPVVIRLRVANLVEGVAFGSSSYKFNLSENQPAGTTVGGVGASSGNPLYDVFYTLKTHTDLFTISTSGAIETKQQLDKEKQEWYILDVEAVDTRSPPTSAIAMVTVQVVDLNEPPQFPSELYRASVVSIAQYKTPVVQVKASDPDVDDKGQLNYSLSADSPYFDVDSSSGQVFVVSVVELAGKKVDLEVKATDTRGLHTTTKVEVTVGESVSSSDVVVMSLNQPANTVEKKAPELEESLGEVLGWTANILSVSSAGGGAVESRTLRMDVKSLVNFICSDKEKVISSEMVRKKMQSESEAVKVQLDKVFGQDTDFGVQEPEPPVSILTISLIVPLTLSMLGLIGAGVVIVRTKTARKNQASSDDTSLEFKNQASSDNASLEMKNPASSDNVSLEIRFEF